MHAVIRTYSGQGAKELFNVLEQDKSTVEQLIRGIKGFVSYSLVRTEQGGFRFPCFRTRLGLTKACGSHVTISVRTQEASGSLHFRCQKVV
jgi:hypothetical protein